LMKLWKS